MIIMPSQILYTTGGFIYKNLQKENGQTTEDFSNSCNLQLNCAKNGHAKSTRLAWKSFIGIITTENPMFYYPIISRVEFLHGHTLPPHISTYFHSVYS